MKRFIFPVIFVILSVHQVARQVKDDNRRSEGDTGKKKEAFVSSTFPLRNKKQPQPRICTIFAIICTQRRRANVVFPRSTVCRRWVCEAPHPLLFLLLKGRTGLSSTGSNLTQLLQLQVNKSKADMWSTRMQEGTEVLYECYEVLQQDGK